MLTTYKKASLPIFDGDEDNYDKWEIQWKAFAQVENIVSALGNALDTNMPAYVLEYKKTEKIWTTDEEKKTAGEPSSNGILGHGYGTAETVDMSNYY